MDHLPKHRKSPWHAGERALQEIVHASEQMEVIGQKVIRNYMPDQHREFYHQLPFIVVGAVDTDGRPWATLLEGPEGFVTSADPQHLLLAAQTDPHDPAASGLQAGHAIGMLGIELHTRRRNRINGVIQQVSAEGLEVSVEHSYGNCPKYIQERSYTRVAESSSSKAPRRDFNALDEYTSALIRTADTFFIASYVDHDAHNRSVDVSHRGGRAGFVKVEGNRLTIPDYAGNLFFNTLGNLHTNPIAGLLFIDFATGDTLQLSGRSELLLDSPLIKSFEGAERLWTVEVEHVVLRPAAVAIRWQFHGYAPTSLATGIWDEADERVRQCEQRRQWQQWRVARVQQESRDIRSFYLEPQDSAVVPFAAGQHLPMRIMGSEEEALVRTYSVSSAPSDGHIRISVKLQGKASRHLHEHVQVGDLLEVRMPLGSFTLVDENERPVVLIGAGVGITPMISMVRELVAQNQQHQRTRKIHLFQSARTLEELPFQLELAELLQGSAGLLHIHRALSNPGTEALLDRDYQLAGRLAFAQVKARLPLDDYDFYLCGPAGFLQDMYDGLRGVNIPDHRIHAEAFGPSALRRSETELPPTWVQPPAAGVPVPVYFSASATEARWKPDSGSLLELAESRGLTPEFSCRGGSCGTCAARLISGSVHYTNPPAQLPDGDKVLICCAVPAQTEGTPLPLVLDL
ncbi:2Fe-2S iron-sulfur cluster binding domain-containing protein [Pseudomonas sp. BN415]|uniref:pyridoxamine 5'-phosphate oxidase family protein n=1 Tax=Pseudomonas sp. BN415 TaxID=2567889 RepID=UPI002458151B|nr:pyridoxamine 5'-phosphate oxidase family protein [Pseudomonas sp. BN415]MDH4582546.1 2Fe-2S iron-sulfur cluster binding domain-containing protein [Pseudomonas sp. BN415]